MGGLQLLGKKVLLTISEPWDFDEKCNGLQFGGRITDIDTNYVLLALDDPITCGSMTYLTVTCQVRHEGSSSNDIVVRPPLPVYVTFHVDQVDESERVPGEDSNTFSFAIGGLELLSEAR